MPKQNAKITATILTKTLLSRLGNLAKLPKAVLMAYDLDTNNNANDNNNDNNSPSSHSPSLSRLDYLQHFRHIDVDRPLEYGDGWYSGPDMHFSDELLAYIGQDEFADAHRLDYMVPGDLQDYFHRIIQTKCLWVVLRREVSWAIAEPILEQLHSLVIPLSTMDRYADVVGRLASLEHIRFFLDEINLYSEDEIFLRDKQARFDQALTKVLQFIKDHVHLIKGCLKSIDFSFDPYQSSKSPYPLEIRQEILRLCDHCTNQHSWLQIGLSLRSIRSPQTLGASSRCPV